MVRKRVSKRNDGARGDSQEERGRKRKKGGKRDR